MRRAKVGNPLNERTSYTYNRFKSRVTEMNPLGYVTTFGFDNMNRPSGMMDALGNLSTVHYTGNRKVADENALGFRTSYTYDFSSRLTGVQDPRGNVWTSVYDNRDLVARMDPQGNLATSVFDRVGGQVASVSPLGFRTTQIFDAAGQLSASQDALGYRTSYSYDGAGNRTVVQDANGKLTTSVYLTNRNLVQATVNVMGYRTTYAHDVQSRLISTLDANGGYVTNVYDSVGRLSVVQNQLGENARQYGYDLAGRVVTMADVANRVRSYTFDAAGQNTATQFPDGTIATNLYDRVGRRTTMVDWGGTSTYAFDALGRQSGQTDAAGFVQLYSYDGNGNRTGLNLVGTGLFTYTFDSLNRLATAQKPGNQLYTLSYDADSRRTTMMLGNGSTRQYAYEARSQLTTQVELNASSTPIVTLIDSYDAVGNRMTRSVNGTISTWAFDDLYRLTGQMKSGQVATYTLDGVGNLKTMWEGGSFPKTFTVDAADKIVTMVEGVDLTTYTWTGYGALASEVTGNATTAYSYSGQDQLVGITDPNGVKSTYSFSGDGARRTAQNGNVPPTTMVWDGADYLLLNGPASNQVILTLGGEIVASGSHDLLPDSLGSILGDIRSGFDPRLLYEYWPYGNRVDGAGVAPFPFLYLGNLGYYTEFEAVYYVRARHLNALIARWCQLDPAWPFERPYAYTDGRPVVLTDPSGIGVRVCQRPLRLRDCNPKCKANPKTAGYHWWFETDLPGCSSCGYGPGGQYCTPPHNLGAGYPSDILCTPTQATWQQEKCLCDLLKNIRDKKWIACGSTWEDSPKCRDYNLLTHNCQSFVVCLFTKCGVPLPSGWLLDSPLTHDTTPPEKVGSGG